ncbi:hypothetical protein CC78DRAFT_581744 [Lojkania enalia]|uniref:Mid2 domain-containing protein n=1 Tax=Lojkania enalia TaxID=147567 RepID=A0A9P4K8T1_9PLEO|nr:hypothetical protein CC78DRAFT_581744 [Didymosphaeria enalia]
MRGFLFPWDLIVLLLCTSLIAQAANVLDQLLITAPPTPQATYCPNEILHRRQESCSFGECGGKCLDQGAFCCGPAGSLVTSPYWVCDNGACITSVRGTTGIVDCYDPDNPSGTTQSCIDHEPTATCKPTDRCFTCHADEPYCFWQTYIASGQPTLSWFSCIESKLPDATFLAATITTNLLTTDASSVSSSTTSFASDTENGSPLSTGAIIGIAVGGGVAVVGSLAILAYFCLKRRHAPSTHPQELSSGPETQQKIMQQVPTQPENPTENPTELDSRAYTRSELDSATAYSPPHSQSAIPFSPHEGYARDVEQIDMWRRAMGARSTELPRQMSLSEQQSSELFVDRPDIRDSWGYGDDSEHMSPRSNRNYNGGNI